MILRTLFVASALAFPSFHAGAQIIRGRVSGGTSPYAVSASIGFVRASTVVDGSTHSEWDFGSGLQYRFAAERRVGGQSGLGASVSYANMPLVYFRSLGAPPSSVCSISCDATSDVWTLAATYHVGGGFGFHQILELGLGVTWYSDFREDATGAKLAPEDGDKDFSFSLGYGFGVGIGEHFEIRIVQDAGLTVHQRAGLAGNENGVNQILVTRLGVRVGLGR